MNVTLQLILNGLLLLSFPEATGNAVAVFPRDHMHEFTVLMLAGSVEAEGNSDCEGIIVSADSAGVLGSIEGELSLEYPADDIDVLGWTRNARGPLPKSEQEIEDLFWLPSLSSMVGARSDLRRGCEAAGGSCPGAKARLFLDRGDVAVCHLVHDPAVADTIQLYELPTGWPQALADTIVVKDELQLDEGESLVLKIEEHRCKLIPDDENNLLLVLSNAPLQEAVGSLTTHFTMLHQFHDNPLHRASRTRPDPLGNFPWKGSSLGACEASLITAQDLLDAAVSQPQMSNRRSLPQEERMSLFRRRVHSPTECGTASQP